jgi:hypothetical protein
VALPRFLGGIHPNIGILLIFMALNINGNPREIPVKSPVSARYSRFYAEICRKHG